MNKYILEYPSDGAIRPSLAEAIIKTKVLVDILDADISSSSCTMMIEVLGNAKGRDNLLNYLKKQGVNVKKVSSHIEKSESSCVDCGACVGVCPTNAISMIDLSQDIDEDKCVRCGACVEVCPVRALSLKKV